MRAGLRQRQVVAVDALRPSRERHVVGVTDEPDVHVLLVAQVSIENTQAFHRIIITVKVDTRIGWMIIGGVETLELFASLLQMLACACHQIGWQSSSNRGGAGDDGRGTMDRYPLPATHPSP